MARQQKGREHQRSSGSGGMSTDTLSDYEVPIELTRIKMARLRAERLGAMPTVEMSVPKKTSSRAVVGVRVTGRASPHYERIWKKAAASDNVKLPARGVAA